MPFKTTLKRIKCTSNKLIIKEVKAFSLKAITALMKENEDYTKKWKYIPCSWIRK